MKKNYQFVGPFNAGATYNLIDQNNNPVTNELVFQIGIENPNGLPLLQSNYGGQVGEADQTMGKISLFSSYANPQTTFIINRNDILEFTNLKISGGAAVSQGDPNAGHYTLSFVPYVNLSEYAIIDVAVIDVED